MVDREIIIYPDWSQHQIMHNLTEDNNIITLPRSMIVDTLSIVNNSGKTVGYYVDKVNDSKISSGNLVKIWLKSGNTKPLEMLYVRENIYYSEVDSIYYKFNSCDDDGVSIMSWSGMYESGNPIVNIDTDYLKKNKMYAENLQINYLLGNLKWRSHYTGVIDSNNNMNLTLKGTISNDTDEIINVDSLKLAGGDVRPPKQNSKYANRAVALSVQNSNEVYDDDFSTSSIEELQIFDTDLNVISKGETNIPLKEYSIPVQKLYVYKLNHYYTDKYFYSDSGRTNVVYRFNAPEKMVSGDIHLYIKANNSQKLVYLSSSRIKRSGLNQNVELELSGSPVEINTEYRLSYQSKDGEILSNNKTKDNEDNKLDKILNIKIKVEITNNLNSSILIALQDELENIISVNPTATIQTGNLYEWQFKMEPQQTVEAFFEITMTV